MKSLKTVYKIGNGPSSSHTVGPYRAAQIIKSRYPDADEFNVTLYGSLAFTGAGHGTEVAIKTAIPDAKIFSDIKETNLPHPNTMRFVVKQNGKEVCDTRIMSIGGGSIQIENEEDFESIDIYKQKNFTEIMDYCESNGLSLSEFAYKLEGEDLKKYLAEIWNEMQACVERGLSVSGILPGGLDITRKAKKLYELRCYNENSDIRMDRLVAAYAYAVTEENADGHIVVTAPTCGSCGVIPAVMYYMSRSCGYPDDEIIDALAAAAIVGNVIRTNASISGAECGCQAEIGSACSMAAAGLGSLYKLNLKQIEYAAEVAMEHHLGLTCDPVNGLVQIPCIERNAVAAMRAMNAVNLARFLYETRRISLDDVIATMYQTGLDLSEKYRETSHGGLAALYNAQRD
ncbi:MAG: L-serine ammonia-lyase, iron-sulfur-dependent, subunit alpha [Bacillota bacterium]|nr:L-serine ammonia-lyase, iron-sulfur-dependent, subunit alpha [Bacillota bacterium]